MKARFEKQDNIINVVVSEYSKLTKIKSDVMIESKLTQNKIKET